MRAPISVVIPSLNAAAALPACLAALVEGLQAGLIREVILSDGGSADGTPQLAEGWGGEVISGAPSRGGQLRRGCEAARGEWLLVIHADTVLAPGWTDAVQDHMARGTGAAGWFRLRFDQRGPAPRLVAGWANLRSACGLPYGDQGLLLPRALYDAVGGYPDQPLMEDVALARALRGRLARLEGIAVTSAEKYRRQGWLRRGGRNLWTLMRYAMGTSPEALAVSYRRS
ncbi:MAG: TIGR04283 family arsenosugar biosynthesis glycosyltransferase [Sulfitobacter sp.]|jgi:rSAM/selenodomain-associated transferase 2|uniref:TIGR04283 family arsenosugar biosynthesis glycosyltransferase n=1 Tax=unclassified Sulfitobacter TaxID=196795 RepID=UPI00294346F2|nr:TIGR04283 family arsenosugar biosynthesis glycosyltransferase [Sulfitobacter sp. LC.270.F.C4]WOI14694.1 TIGR04283 family arsenosugar biosynthesis glycosyltransferase [Sulfitobacter sp. LC.270.F.C4]